jgi:hypothetical protein
LWQGEDFTSIGQGVAFSINETLCTLPPHKCMFTVKLLDATNTNAASASETMDRKTFMRLQM